MFGTIRVSGSGPGVSGASELFQLLRDGQPRTRAELAALTGLARSTIAQRVDSLLDLGLIRPVSEATSSGGRPPSQFAINPLARVVLAADFGAFHAVIAVTDLGGSILAQRRSRIDIVDGPQKVLAWMVETQLRLLEEAGRDRADVVAVGIGLPGPVEHGTGRPSNPPIMPGWDGFDVPTWVQRDFNVPVLVDNDVNIMAIGERSIAWPATDDFMFVKVSTGIGSGLISGGLLQRGAQGTAGDIGHVPIKRGAETPCRCGNLGCLEALASGPAIATALRAAGIAAAESSDVVELVRSGNLEAIQAVRQAGRDVGEVLIACVSLMNPSVIALGGSIAAAGEHLLAGVREVVYQRSMPLSTEHLSIVQSRAGDDAGVIGASILAIEHALSPAGIDALLDARLPVPITAVLPAKSRVGIEAAMEGRSR